MFLPENAGSCYHSLLFIERGRKRESRSLNEVRGGVENRNLMEAPNGLPITLPIIFSQLCLQWKPSLRLPHPLPPTVIAILFFCCFMSMEINYLFM